jgi:hypothetical protein
VIQKVSQFSDNTDSKMPSEFKSNVGAGGEIARQSQLDKAKDADFNND